MWWRVSTHLNSVHRVHTTNQCRGKTGAGFLSAQDSPSSFPPSLVWSCPLTTTEIKHAFCWFRFHGDGLHMKRCQTNQEQILNTQRGKHRQPCSAPHREQNGVSGLSHLMVTCTLEQLDETAGGSSCKPEVLQKNMKVAPLCNKGSSVVIDPSQRDAHGQLVR